MPKKIMSPSAFKNIKQKLHQYDQQKLSLNTKSKRIQMKMNDVKGIGTMMKTIYWRGDAYQKEVIENFKKKCNNPMEIMEKTTKHMDHCLVQVSQRVFEVVPKLKKYVKVDRHGYTRVYHIMWRDLQFEVQRASDAYTKLFNQGVERFNKLVQRKKAFLQKTNDMEWGETQP